jgi:phosphoglycolate phosphatase-like HAD superfamily hydrolase
LLSKNYRLDPRLLQEVGDLNPGSADGAIKPLSIQNVLKKWNISPQYVAYVGDSPYDMQAAKEAGVIPLGAAWAETASLQLLDEMSPAATFHTVDNFIDWIGGYCKSSVQFLAPHK